MIRKSENSTHRPPESEKHKAGPVAIICLYCALWSYGWFYRGAPAILLTSLSANDVGKTPRKVGHDVPWEAQTLKKSGRTCITPDASALWKGFCLNMCYAKWFRTPSKSNTPVIHPVWKTIQSLPFDFSINNDWRQQKRPLSHLEWFLSRPSTNRKEVCENWRSGL